MPTGQVLWWYLVLCDRGQGRQRCAFSGDSIIRRLALPVLGGSTESLGGPSSDPHRRRVAGILFLGLAGWAGRLLDQLASPRAAPRRDPTTRRSSTSAAPPCFMAAY